MLRLTRTLASRARRAPTARSMATIDVPVREAINQVRAGARLGGSPRLAVAASRAFSRARARLTLNARGPALFSLSRRLPRVVVAAAVAVVVVVAQGLDEEMERDDKVFVMGEEVAQYQASHPRLPAPRFTPTTPTNTTPALSRTSPLASLAYHRARTR